MRSTAGAPYPRVAVSAAPSKTWSVSSCSARSSASGNVRSSSSARVTCVRGLAVAVLAQRVLARLPSIPQGPLEVPAALEMHGELAGDLPRARAVAALEALAGPQMQPARSPTATRA